MRVYLDWNATTPPHDEVLDAMREAARSSWANPASVHAHGRAARKCVEDARAAVAELVSADARDVVLTSGGTEANNIAVRSAFAGRPAGGEPPWLVTSRLEHPSVARVAESLEVEGKARVRWLGVRPEGTIDVAELARTLEAGTADVALVAVQAVNHETGILQPIAEISALVRAAGVRFHVDAVQAFGRVAMPALREADTVALAGHKFRGPKGIGALVAGRCAPLAPVMLGGAQEKGLRPGTVDPVLAAGLAVAARRALSSEPAWAAVAPLRDELEFALLAMGRARGARVVGDPSRRAPHVSNIVWPTWSGAELVAALDLEGVSVSSGAACSAGTVEPSPVLRAMLGAREAASGLRISLGEATTREDVAFALDIFGRVLAR